MSDPKLVKHANGVFYVHWTATDRRSKTHSTRCRDHADAAMYLVRWLREKPKHKAHAETVAGLWAVYRAKHVATNTVSAEHLDSVWRRLQPHFGFMQPRHISETTVASYGVMRRQGRLGRPAVPGTIRKEIVALLACLNWCAHPRRKLLAKADVPDIELPEASPRRDRWLRLDEVRALLDACEPGSRVELFIWLALETAARKSAIQELTWDRVDFETGVIHYGVPGARATTKRRVSAPISKSLMPVLARAYADRTGPFVLEGTADVWRELKAVAARAGVAGVSPHVFRHTAATQMARKGVPIAHIADLLGNTVAVTESTYRHHCQDATRRAVEMISGGAVQPA